MISPGITNRLTQTVTDQMTADRVGSGLAKVFATPMMIAMMEKTCADSVAPLLPEGHSTVGTHINVSHCSATPIGLDVWCDSELVEVDRRRLLFNVKAYDPCGLIGEGQHERFIVDNAKFQANTESKAKQTTE